MLTRKLAFSFLVLLLGPIGSSGFAADKPKITLDEFFNYVNFTAVNMSPDGTGVVIGTDRADWEQRIFQKDLWLYRDDGHGANSSMIQLTHSGRDSDPQWSPDGKWIAFLSERKNANGKGGDENENAKEDNEINQLYLISASGGEAFPLTEGEEEVHAFGWSSDGKSLFFATRDPWSKEQKDAYKKEWKDTIQYRAGERGDRLFSLDVDRKSTRLNSSH